MSRLELAARTSAENVLETISGDVARRVMANPVGVCPVDMALGFLQMCHAQTCGKCVPCRVGLGQMREIITNILDGKGDKKSLALLGKLAEATRDTADCAIGYEAAEMVLRGLDSFMDDYLSHIEKGRCSCRMDDPVPCVALCPAHVDIPGYVALVGEGRYADAVRLIRKDNPFSVACALVCEHPCEMHCRRNMVDDAVNIRGLKRVAVDNAGAVPAPECAPDTGKKVAVVGGGPGGLTAAWFLRLMGHSVTVYESKKQLGGMLRYGIPSYRLPRERLDEDINAILSTGVDVKLETSVGKDITFEELREENDVVCISIGAHSDNEIGIEGEDAEGVISAVEMLRGIGDNVYPDFTGKNVVVIGGGNVAMDCVRSAMRLGAASACVAYRRRKEDMTALPAEIESAIAEGCEMRTLLSPSRIETDENGHVAAFWAKPQIIGKVERGRPKPENADKPEIRIPADLVIVAIGQKIESEHFEQAGIKTKWGRIVAMKDCAVADMPEVFAGGDCVTGPATVIKAIAAGKTAAANIDAYLGFDHKISVDVEIPEARITDRPACGRVNLVEKDAAERKTTFEESECGMSIQEACQEAGRCLRCDRYGFATIRGGRTTSW